MSRKLEKFRFTARQSLQFSDLFFEMTTHAALVNFCMKGSNQVGNKYLDDSSREMALSDSIYFLLDDVETMYRWYDAALHGEPFEV